MGMDLPIYKMTIKPGGTDTGVEAIAFVDNPAIERNWLAFKSKALFKVESEERRIVSGPLMIADMPIYRRTPDMGEFYVVFDAPTISEISQKFLRDNNANHVNLMHDPKAPADGCYMIESFIIDQTRGIQAPKGFEDLSEGSWFGSFKVENDAVWAMVKDGTFKGFSVEGFFDLTPMRSMADEIEGLIKTLAEIVQ